MKNIVENPGNSKKISVIRIMSCFRDKKLQDFVSGIGIIYMSDLKPDRFSDYTSELRILGLKLN